MTDHMSGACSSMMIVGIWLMRKTKTIILKVKKHREISVQFLVLKKINDRKDQIKRMKCRKETIWSQITKSNIQTEVQYRAIPEHGWWRAYQLPDGGPVQQRAGMLSSRGGDRRPL
jgi:hypothetical protein